MVERTTNEKSLMPEVLLESLDDREQLELLKFPYLKLSSLDEVCMGDEWFRATVHSFCTAR